MTPITAYRCGTCRRVTLTPRAMKTHEQQCLSNPVVRACFTCEHDAGPDRCLAGVRPDRVKVVRLCVQWSGEDWQDEEGVSA